jgi:hypothetical protein
VRSILDLVEAANRAETSDPQVCALYREDLEIVLGMYKKALETQYEEEPRTTTSADEVTATAHEEKE